MCNHLPQGLASSSSSLSKASVPSHGLLSEWHQSYWIKDPSKLITLAKIPFPKMITFRITPGSLGLQSLNWGRVTIQPITRGEYVLSISLGMNPVLLSIAASEVPSGSQRPRLERRWTPTPHPTPPPKMENKARKGW